MQEAKPAKVPFWKRRVFLVVLVLAAVPVLFGLWVFADWWIALPEETVARYVGSQSCIQCHQPQAKDWHGSHHDLAMDRATEKTVLGDFNNAELTHFGITSRMFRDGKKFIVHTEGPDGDMADFEVKYVFGVEPLQQYMVEFDRPADMPQNEIARVQVLRLSWDTKNKRWFYLSPPDVDEKLSPHDDLHWTGIAQRWNTMCAECHSTNLQKRYNPATQTYHTTFTNIDVGCEACHGPGSVHVELAENKKLFWDRKRGYGLPKLKSEHPEIEIQTCAQCHSRRRIVHPDYRPGENYYDYYHNELLFETTYHADGQILDEVYVFGSYIQSEMYHKGIRCTDCHEPHTARLKEEGNRVCTSCHQHPAYEYDVEAHHHHKPGTKGAFCVECHMPETTYMDVDPRRDHSLRVPRPDLSVAWGTPNACTRCHIEDAEIDEEKRESFDQYQDWLLAAKSGDDEVKDELARLDRWADEHVAKWFGEERQQEDHFAEALHLARRGDRDAQDALIRLLADRDTPAIAQATALFHLSEMGTPESFAAAKRALSSRDPQVRFAALGCMETQMTLLELRSTAALSHGQLLSAYRPVVQLVLDRLHDPVRLVRTEAARVLAMVPQNLLPFLLVSQSEKLAWQQALKDYKQGLLVTNDRAASHLGLGLLHERLGDQEEAIRAYRRAIQVEPTFAGPRSNLAALLDRQAEEADRKARQASRQRDLDSVQKWAARVVELRGQAADLRRDELPLLARDARLAPNIAQLQYRYGMLNYTRGRLAEAEKALRRAEQIAPDNPQYVLALALLYQKAERWNEAQHYADRFSVLAPGAYPEWIDDIRNRRPPRDSFYP